jgi:hypothetical protein
VLSEIAETVYKVPFPISLPPVFLCLLPLSRSSLVATKHWLAADAILSR